MPKTVADRATPQLLFSATRPQAGILPWVNCESKAPYEKKANNGRKVSSETLMTPSADGDLGSGGRRAVGRRSFLGATGALFLPASVILAAITNSARDDSDGNLSQGDASILRFLAAAEILESDIWELSSAAGITSGFASTNPATGTAVTRTGII